MLKEEKARKARGFLWIIEVNAERRRQGFVLFEQGFAREMSIVNAKDVGGIAFHEFAVMAHHQNKFMFSDGLHQFKDQGGVMFV